MAYFSRVREGEGVRHRDFPSRVLFVPPPAGGKKTQSKSQMLLNVCFPRFRGQIGDVPGGIVGVLGDHFKTISGRVWRSFLKKLGILGGSFGDELRISWR